MVAKPKSMKQCTRLNLSLGQVLCKFFAHGACLKGEHCKFSHDWNNTLRACPIYRKISYFAVPSVIWYATIEEKQEIIDTYKENLKSIDCKHFEFGDGNCPFGASCFYKHAYRDGRLEKVALQRLGATDGDTIIAKDIRLRSSSCFYVKCLLIH
ncbi:unnamed protein product [Lathyrus sativus]|nr:unnamed protein product [Lathyrus sativus]